MSQRLSSDDRIFLKKVLEASLANPFSEKREIADKSILGHQDVSSIKESKEVADLVTERMVKIKSDEEFHLNQCAREDHTLLSAGILFMVFHKYIKCLDNHIQQQMLCRDENIVFSEGQQILKDLMAWGYARPEAIQYIGLFFQLRRAFALIEGRIIGKSRSVHKLRTKLWGNVFTHNLFWYLEHLWGKMEDFSTLILGETGVGKTTIARVIGCSGFIPYNPQKSMFKENFLEAFQSINLSQYPDSLVESELFGHTKGAFTGAIDHHKGVFDLCSSYGAIFIDELGEIPLDLQVKFLNVLQDRTFTAVGSHHPKVFKGRVIGATHRNIHQLVRDGMFRRDLYYRLCSDIIEVPSLRDRIGEYPGELRLILEQLMKKVSPEVSVDLVDKVELQISSSIRKDYPWPGNIRELEQAVRRICLTGRYIPVNLETGHDSIDSFFQKGLTAKEILSGYAKDLYAKLGTYESVSKAMDLDTRTVKKYLT